MTQTTAIFSKPRNSTTNLQMFHRLGVNVLCGLQFHPCDNKKNRCAGLNERALQKLLDKIKSSYTAKKLITLKHQSVTIRERQQCTRTHFTLVIKYGQLDIFRCSSCRRSSRWCSRFDNILYRSGSFRNATRVQWLAWRYLQSNRWNWLFHLKQIN